MIHYEEIEPHLIDFLQGKAEEATEYRIKAYIQQNPDFQQELDELSETLDFNKTVPLVQPAPELKMNFYAMLNEYKAQKVRPTLRERLKTFLIAQFQWQTIAVSAFTVILLIVAYWSVLNFQEKYKATQVSMTMLEFEKEQQDKAPLILPTPKQKEKNAKKETENIAQGGEEMGLPEATNAPKAYNFPITSEKNKYAQDTPELDYFKESASINPNLYAFTNANTQGTIEISNPLGNINLRSYTGTEVKVESVPAQSFKGEINQDKIAIQGLASAPQMDMQVYVPQNRALLLNVSAKQNIIADLTDIQVANNSSLISFAGDVEVHVPTSADLEVYASGKELENDFESNVKNIESKSLQTNAIANFNRDAGNLKDKATVKTVPAKRKERTKETKSKKENKKDDSRQARSNQDMPPLAEKVSKDASGISAPEKIAEDAEMENVPQPPVNVAPDRPQRTTQATIKKGGKKLQINSIQGKAKIKKAK